jgi:hypothetical protein
VKGAKMFKIGDTVTFGYRTSDGGKARSDSRTGMIIRLKGKVVAVNEGPKKNLVVVKHPGKQYERFPERIYNLRPLSGGYVLEGERNDPKGRMYMETTK